MSSSGCCGRLEGDFLTQHGRPVFEERRANMNAMGPLYRAIRERFGDAVEIDVVDPRSFVSLCALLIRDFLGFHVGVREALRTLTNLPVRGVVLNGRLVARGEWPEPGKILALLETAVADAEASVT